MIRFTAGLLLIIAGVGVFVYTFIFMKPPKAVDPQVVYGFFAEFNDSNGNKHEIKLADGSAYVIRKAVWKEFDTEAFVKDLSPGDSLELTIEKDKASIIRCRAKGVTYMDIDYNADAYMYHMRENPKIGIGSIVLGVVVLGTYLSERRRDRQMGIRVRLSKVRRR